MLSAPARRVLVSCTPCDMRRGIEGLARMVECELGHDPFAEATYVFVSRRGDKARMLRWGLNGLWPCYKKLARGTFRRAFKGEAMLPGVGPRQLGWLLDGLALDQPLAHRPVTQRVMV